jgi:hypothetical protein
MTPDKNFRMKSEIKGMIALMKGSREDKNHFKRMMINSQLHEEAARRAALKSKEKENDGGKARGAVAPE